MEKEEEGRVEWLVVMVVVVAVREGGRWKGKSRFA